MKQNWDYNIEDILFETKEMIHDLENQLDAGDTNQEAEEIFSEIYKGELDSLKKDYRLKSDGNVEIRLLDDQMQAYADFYPSSLDGEELKLEKIEYDLEKAGIISGINWDIIHESIFLCNTESRQILDVLIARGTQSSHEIPEHFQIEEKFLPDSKPRIEKPDSDTENINFRNISKFILVQQGDKVARLVPKKNGIFGMDVKGTQLPFKTEGKTTYIKPGKNIRIDADGAFASIAGRFFFSENTFWINEVLDIKTDVDYSTGNIDFPGDVVIHGHVKEGFTVETGGSLFCMKTLDATNIVCEKDIHINQGIIGKNQGIIKCKGTVTCNFIENCYLETHGAITVKTGILNSVINTRESIRMGKKGVIVGGKLTAQNGIAAFQAGSLRGPKTSLICGIDFLTKQKLEWIRDKNIEILSQIKKIEANIAKLNDPKPELFETQKNLKEGLNRLNQSAIKIISTLDRNQDAIIIIHGTVFSNTYIEICNVSHVVTRNVSNVAYYLDPASGRIKQVPLSTLPKENFSTLSRPV